MATIKARRQAKGTVRYTAIVRKRVGKTIVYRDALAMNPKVLPLDEPFGALDALTRAHLQDQVMQIHADLGNTVMMITHDVEEAVLLSDRIVMMTNGPAAGIGSVLKVDLPTHPLRRRSLTAADTEDLRTHPRRDPPRARVRMTS